MAVILDGLRGFRTVYPLKPWHLTRRLVPSQNRCTAFGYHLIKVSNRRNSPASIGVAHHRFTSQGDKVLNTSKTAIDSLYQLVKGGADFGELASSNSDDRGSATKNGELPWFGTGRMVAEFEQAAFALQNQGDISEPIQSAYGWHIIKLMDTKPIPSFETKKSEIERLIKRDERAQAGNQAFIGKLKKDYKLKFAKGNAKADFYTLLQEKTLTDSAFLAEASNLKKPMFSFAKQTFKQDDFLSYLKENPSTEKSSAQDIIDEKLNEFIDKELLAYEDSQLERNTMISVC